MSIDAFTITPSIFEINCEQSISINVTFEPRFPMFYVCFVDFKFIDYNSHKIEFNSHNIVIFKAITSYAL